MSRTVEYGGRDYIEYNRGHFDCGLSVFSGNWDTYGNPIYLEICYSSGDECVLGADFTESHPVAVRFRD